MARHSKYREFLQVFFELSDSQTQAAFAERCGKYTSQISSRMNGSCKTTATFVRSCLANFCAWELRAIAEIEEIPKRNNELPETPGIYILYDSGGNVLYIGKATNFRNEIYQTQKRLIPIGLRKAPNLKKTRPKIGDLAKYMSLYEVKSAKARHNMESILLRAFANQTHNSNIGTFR